jgi:hypothetical protein
MAGAAPQHFWMIRVGVLNYVVPVMSGPAEEGTEMPSDEGASDSSDALTRDVSATDAGEAVTEALSDAARQAVMSPKVRAAVLAAVQGKTTGPLGLESPAISRAVNTALADAATQAVMNPDVQRSIREAVRTTTLGLPGLQTPAITRAVNTAFADAAKQAVLSPQVNQAFRDAVRWQAARGNVTAPDPAVALALEAAATHAEPHAGTVTQEPEARARPVLSVGLFSPDFAGPGIHGFPLIIPWPDHPPKQHAGAAGPNSEARSDAACGPCHVPAIGSSCPRHSAALLRTATEIGSCPLHPGESISASETMTGYIGDGRPLCP